MDSTVVEIRTGGREAVVDLGGDIDGFLRSVGAREGLLNVWVPHATAGLAVIETGAGSDADLLAALATCCPRTTVGATVTAAPVTAVTTCCRRSLRRRCRCPC